MIISEDQQYISALKREKKKRGWMENYLSCHKQHKGKALDI